MKSIYLDHKYIIRGRRVYHYWCCEFESRSVQGVLDTTLCDKVCQWLATGRWFSPGPPVSSTDKTDRHHITEILLKVALNTIKQSNKHNLIHIFLLLWDMSSPLMFNYTPCRWVLNIYITTRGWWQLIQLQVRQSIKKNNN